MYSHTGHQKVFTLVELLIVIVIIGLILVIALTAVQASREAACRATCTNNLRQLGIALHGYQSQFGVFPRGSNGSGLSLHAAILPQLEQQALYNSINQDWRTLSSTMADWPNFTVQTTRLSMFMCPSNSGPTDSVLASTNYGGSRGVERRDRVDNGAFAFWSETTTSPRDFSDGTASTAMISEWVIGPLHDGVIDDQGSIFEINHGLHTPDALEAFVTHCSQVDIHETPIGANDKGTPWMLGAYHATLYNHLIKPKGHSCLSEGMVQEGAYSAGSFHPDLTQVLFSDGHSQSINASVTLPVWRALGTRDGSEVISLPE